MLDACAYPPLAARTAPPPPVARMLRGMAVDEAAALLPRLFNLCREAQGLAARAALGLPVEAGWPAALRREILRAHVAKLAIQWPALLGVPPLSLTRDWQSNTDRTRRTLFGAGREMPRSAAGFARFLVAEDGVAPVLAALAERFAPGVACRESLPETTPGTVFSDAAQDPSPAARHAAQPVMQEIEARLGRGPLWAATGLCLDLDRLLDGGLPDAVLPGAVLPDAAPGPRRAVVPAARGF